MIPEGRTAKPFGSRRDIKTCFMEGTPCLLSLGSFPSSVGVGAFDDPKNPTNKRTAEDVGPYKGFAIPPPMLSFASFVGEDIILP